LRVLISGIESSRFDSNTLNKFKVFFRLYSYPKKRRRYGFGVFYSFDSSMSAKHAQRLINDPKSLCARVLPSTG
jgi:hypothetical protein